MTAAGAHQGAKNTAIRPGAPTATPTGGGAQNPADGTQASMTTTTPIEYR